MFVRERVRNSEQADSHDNPYIYLSLSGTDCPTGSRSFVCFEFTPVGLILRVKWNGMDPSTGQAFCTVVQFLAFAGIFTLTGDHPHD